MGENVGESVDLAGLLWALSCPIVGAVMDILTRQVLKLELSNGRVPEKRQEKYGLLPPHSYQAQLL